MGVGIRTAKFGKNLQGCREQRGLKQQDLGQRLGHKTGAKVSAWEKGTVVPSLELTAELAAQLGVTTSQLLGEVAPLTPGSHVTNNVVNGTHHTVYQHVEGMMLLSEEFEDRVRQVVREEMEQCCARVLEEVRALCQTLQRPPEDRGGQDGPPDGG